jgi:GNAT superfamily N-acetyltransferase
MEVSVGKKIYRWHWFWNIVKHGMLLQGIRNRLALLGIDIMPYYWTLEGAETITCPEVKGDASGFKDKDLSNYIKEGQVCVGIKDNYAIVAFMFIKRDVYPFRGKTFYLQNNEGYLHSMYTFEAYRGRKIAPYLRYQCYEICKDLGLNKNYSISEYFNTSSKRFKQKLKAKQIKLYLSIILFKRYKKTLLIRRYM